MRCPRPGPQIAARVHNVALIGTHVTIEPLTLEHAEELWPAVADVAISILWPRRLQSLDDLREQCQILIEQAGTEAFLLRAPDGTAAGSTTFYGINEAPGSAIIGWTFIAKPFRRTALNTETKLLLLTEAFEVQGLNRIQFDVDSRNQVSRNAVLRLGAKQEGILRNNKVLWDGYIRDTVIFSILKDE
jgi:RimJ/RimL family protein N-acetyltransferase